MNINIGRALEMVKAGKYWNDPHGQSINNATVAPALYELAATKEPTHPVGTMWKMMDYLLQSTKAGSGEAWRVYILLPLLHLMRDDIYLLDKIDNDRIASGVEGDNIYTRIFEYMVVDGETVFDSEAT